MLQRILQRVEIVHRSRPRSWTGTHVLRAFSWSASSVPVRVADSAVGMSRLRREPPARSTTSSAICLHSISESIVSHTTLTRMHTAVPCGQHPGLMSSAQAYHLYILDQTFSCVCCPSFSNPCLEEYTASQSSFLVSSLLPHHGTVQYMSGSTRRSKSSMALGLPRMGRPWELKGFLKGQCQRMKKNLRRSGPRGPHGRATDGSCRLCLGVLVFATARLRINE